MQPIYLLDLASRKTSWLAAREAAIAGNVANSNTPGYRAKDVASFEDVLAKTKLDLSTTDAGHLSVGGASELDSTPVSDESNEIDVTETGNTVGAEQEMIKAGEVNRDYALTTNIVKTFHTMLMASLRES